MVAMLFVASGCSSTPAADLVLDRPTSPSPSTVQRSPLPPADPLAAAPPVAALAARSDLPAWCAGAVSVDRSTAPDGTRWAVCQSEDPFGEDRVYVSSGQRWLMHRPRVGFRGPVPLLAIDARRCLVGGLALSLLTDGGAHERVLVDDDGTYFERPTSLGGGRYAARRNDALEWRGSLTGRWRSYALSAP